VAPAVYLPQFRQMPRDGRHRGSQIGVVCRHDVVDQLRNRPSCRILDCADFSRQRGQRVNHGPRIGGDSAARLVERPPAAAAEIDAEFFKHRRGSKVIRYEVTDRSRCYLLIHGCVSLPTQSSGTADGTV
jgi:hypothetical protein